MKTLQHLLLPLALISFVGCDPAQEIPTDFDLPKCSAGEEKHVEFINVAAITYTLPPAPKVGCGVTYAILGAAAVTFSGGQLSIKGDGQAASTSRGRGGSCGTGSTGCISGAGDDRAGDAGPLTQDPLEAVRVNSQGGERSWTPPGGGRKYPA